MVKPGWGAWVVMAAVVWLACAQNRASGQTPGPAESLYLKLRSAGLDKNRIYAVRDGALDRGSIHISLEDGTIGFTEDVGGRITGAFFKGEGEILVAPPNTVERASLALFTGAAILEEKFSAAYFRFNDDVYDRLKPSFRVAEDPAGFLAEAGTAAGNLAQEDALRLFISLANGSAAGGPEADRFLHILVQGNKLGTFDVRYDSLLAEPISAGQHRTVEGVNYYDVWLSFASAAGKGKDSAAAEDPQPDFEITQFKIRARITPPAEIAAAADLDIRARHAGKRVLLFELSRLLQVESVRLGERPVEFIHNQAIEGSQLARRGNDLLAVVLPEPLRDGERIRLTFKYAGRVLSEAANGLLYVGERGTWYPNAGFEMSRYELEFQYPAGWTLVATGRRTDTQAGGSEQTSRWVSERPIPVAGFNLGKYTRSVTRAGDVAVVTYATASLERGFPRPAEPDPMVPDLLKDRRRDRLSLPSAPPLPAPSQNVQSVGSVAARAVDFYQRRFGPFPYSELDLTQFPGNLSQGWPGLIFLSSYSFLRPQERAQLQSDPKVRLVLDQVIAHETAHQWWGDQVIWNGYRDQWIMEALANYSALLLLESRNPAEAREVLQTYRDDLLARNHRGLASADGGPVTLGVRLSSSQLPNGYEAISYGRGTWLLHMLRTMLRDTEPRVAKAGPEEPFLRVLRKLAKDYQGKPLSTTQFIAAFESQLPPSLWYEGRKSLDWFFDSWVNGNAVPSFSLRDMKFSDKGGTTMITGTIVQEHAPDSLVTSVPLYAAVAGKEVFLGRVFAEGEESQFHLSGPAGTRKVLLDPEQTLLSRK